MKEKNDWQIEDPKGKDINVFRRVRDEIGGMSKEDLLKGIKELRLNK